MYQYLRWKYFKTVVCSDFGPNSLQRLSADATRRQRVKVSKGAKIRNRYNQVPHLTQDTNEKVTNSVRHQTREPKGQPFPSR